MVQLDGEWFQANPSPCQWLLAENPRVEFFASAGQSYRIAVEDVRTPFAATGVFTLTVAEVAAGRPTNDGFAEAAVLSGWVSEVAASNVGATRESGEILSARHSIWWRWTAPEDATAEIRTSESEFANRLTAYRGTALSTLEAVTPVGARASSARRDDRVVFPVQAGETYYLSLDGVDGGTGALRLSIQPAPATAPLASVPDVTFTAGGIVRAIVVQEDGKVIIGGEFSQINDVPQRNLARLNRNGSVDRTWNIAADGPVRALAISPETQHIYVGGEFRTLGGHPAGGLGRVLAGGEVDGEFPFAVLGGAVNSIVVEDRHVTNASGYVWLGGDFEAVRSEGREFHGKLARILEARTPEEREPGERDTLVPIPSLIQNRFLAPESVVHVLGMHRSESDWLFVGGVVPIGGEAARPRLLKVNGGFQSPEWGASIVPRERGIPPFRRTCSGPEACGQWPSSRIANWWSGERFRLRMACCAKTWRGSRKTERSIRPGARIRTDRSR